MERRPPHADPVHRGWPLLAPCVLLVAVLYLGSLGGASLDRTAITMVLNAMLVVGTYVFVGNSGVFSFGHLAFMAVGAYTGGLLQMPPEIKEVLLPNLPGFLNDAHFSAIPATLIAGAAAAVVALVLAVPLMRMSALNASLATFAVLLIVNVVAKNWDNVTHGTAGLSPVPATTTRTSAIVWALILIAVAWLYQESRFGLRLRASREDEVAARAVGIDVPLERTIAWVLSAFVVGVAGALYAAFLVTVGPDLFYLGLAALTIIMLVVGGVGSLGGAVVGAVVISAISEALRRFEVEVDRTGLKEVGFAVIMLLILILRPAGITGGREILWPLGGRLLGRAGRGAKQASPEGVGKTV